MTRADAIALRQIATRMVERAVGTAHLGSATMDAAGLRDIGARIDAELRPRTARGVEAPPNLWRRMTRRWAFGRS